MRDICQILGVNRSSFYYQPGESPSEAVLLAEIEKLAGAYPRYGYRRITQLLVRQGYTVGTRRVARLMRENHLLVAVKRASCRTTQSLQGEKPWSNLIKNPTFLWPVSAFFLKLTPIVRFQTAPTGCPFPVTGGDPGCSKLDEKTEN